MIRTRYVERHEMGQKASSYARLVAGERRRAGQRRRPRRRTRSGGTTLVGHTVTSRVPWRLTCHWQAGSIQAKPRPLNLAAAVHCFDWTFLLYASLMHSIKLRVGHHWQLWSFILYFVKCIFLTFIICFVFKQKVWSLRVPSFPFGAKYVE